VLLTVLGGLAAGGGAAGSGAGAEALLPDGQYHLPDCVAHGSVDHMLSVQPLE
jgi:hypothetical protein